MREKLKYFVKSVVAYKDLDKGNKITYNNICLKRPNNGISGFDIKKIIGKKLKKKILKINLLDLRYIELVFTKIL